MVNDMSTYGIVINDHSCRDQWKHMNSYSDGQLINDGLMVNNGLILRNGLMLTPAYD